jgi:hypothetical protein
MLAILGTHVLAIESTIRRIAILANALLDIKQSSASTIMVASVALVARVKSFAFACTAVGIKGTMAAVKMTLLACLTAPISITLTGAVVLDFAVRASVLITCALARTMIKLACKTKKKPPP